MFPLVNTNFYQDSTTIGDVSINLIPLLIILITSNGYYNIIICVIIFLLSRSLGTYYVYVNKFLFCFHLYM